MSRSRARPNNLSTLVRRRWLGGTAALLAAPALSAQTAAMPPAATRQPTPAQSLGPFYPRNAAERPRTTDPDLLTVEGGRVITRGVPILLAGRVVDLQGRPLERATVEIWQCDANAVYHHPAGGAENERDAAFQGYGATLTDGAGSFSFRTIRPVPYPGRTPHIHVRVEAGRRSLATQLYLPDDPGNARDFLYSRLGPQERAALSMRLTPTAGAATPLAQLTQFSTQVELVIG